MIGWDMSVGVSVYGNGGMNTDFSGGQISAASPVCGAGAGGFNQASGQTGPYNLLCGSGKLGMNLEQLIIAPTFAKKVNKNHSFGASLLVARQTFKAEGLSGFFAFTGQGAGGPPAFANNNLTNRGNDSTWGYGLKLGWMGQVSDTVTLGASYTSKVRMAKFDKYKDLFAGQGYFDMPESMSLGIAFKANQNGRSLPIIRGSTMPASSRSPIRARWRATVLVRLVASPIRWAAIAAAASAGTA